MTAAYGRVYQNVTRRPDIPLPAKGVYCYLASMANKDGCCFPSIEKMSSELAINRHTLLKHITCLIAAGVIEKNQKRTTGKFAANEYRIANGSRYTDGNNIDGEKTGGEMAAKSTARNAPTNKNIKEQYISSSTRCDSSENFFESRSYGASPEASAQEAPPADLPEIQEIISYLNAQAGTSYRASTRATQQHVHARLNEGFTVEDFKRVIDQKCADWGKDPRMAKYLRPETLFGAKFESYLQAAETTRRAREADEPVFFTEGGLFF